MSIDSELLEKGVISVTLLLFLLAGGSQPIYAQEGEWMPAILGGELQLSSEAAHKGSASPFLPDYSYAGYRWGEEPIPDPAGQILDVTSFGAIPSDGQADTEAVLRAMEEAEQIAGPVIVRFPSGRFILEEILFIERGDFVLQGNGSGQRGTVLYFPLPLKEMAVPRGYEEPLASGNSQFSYRGGVIWTRKKERSSRMLGRVVAGRRGHHTVKLATPTFMEKGDVVRINWFNREGEDGSLLNHVFCPSDVKFGKHLHQNPDRPLVTQEVTVEAVNGKILTIKEPLLHDLQETWTPTITSVQFLEEVGVEHLRVEFPDVEHKGHLKEEGYNAIYLTDLIHSWVQDVHLHNVDSGILSSTSKNITIKDIGITGRRGHYTVKVGNVYGALVKNFEFAASTHVHNPSFNTLSRHSVYTGGRVEIARLDQHRGINHQNLFDNIEVEYDNPRKTLFLNGGSDDWRPAAGAFNTFWNIRVQFKKEVSGLVEVGGLHDAPHARLVGLRGEVPISFEYGPKAYIEGTNQSNIAVPSLYEYQLQRRLQERERPKLAIFSTGDERAYQKGSPVQLEAVYDGGEQIERVTFFVDGQQVGTSINSNDQLWSTTWIPRKNGVHTLSAVATFVDGSSVLSTPNSCSGEQVNVWVGEERGALEGNYPNPFAEHTVIEYALAQTEHVRIEVYDVMGRRVAILADEKQGPGAKTVRLSAKGLRSGIYFFRVQAGTFEETGKAVLVR